MVKDEDVDKILKENERRLDKLLKLTGKGWDHPINAKVSGKYHLCTTCDAPVTDEVLLVTERLRTGDKYHVFCNLACLTNYIWPE